MGKYASWLFAEFYLRRVNVTEKEITVVKLGLHH